MGSSRLATFARRREAFMRRMERGVAVIAAAPPASRGPDVEYPYRQSSDFYYLTGFPEQGALAVLAPQAEKRFVLFVQPRDPKKEVWTGARAGVEGALEQFGADAAFSSEELERELPKWLSEAERLYYHIGGDEALDRRILSLFAAARDGRIRSGTGPFEIVDPQEILHEMRLVKEAEELTLIRQAVRITAAGHERAMREVAPGRREYEIEAAIDYAFRSMGALGPAYPTIVASGPNAATLHHRTASRTIEAGELVLVDAGAEYELYCADVSRTIPASGSFSPEQRALYEIVLGAQREAIAAAVPGATWDDVHRAAVKTLCEGLVGTGLIKASVEEALERELYASFYMHRTSHWLGMDVHDAGRYKKGGEATVLRPGMVLTIEPGLYIAAGRQDVEERWRGIGIRIEDDLLVTEKGAEILTAAIPKEIPDIEGATR